MSQTALSFTRFLFLFLFFTASVKAQKEAKDFNVDSTLYAYYQRCQECLLQPVVLSMSDTLYFIKTQWRGTGRGQASWI